MLSDFDAELSTVEDFDTNLGEDLDVILSGVRGGLVDGFLVGNSEQKYVINNWRAYCELEGRVCLSSEYRIGSDTHFVHVDLAPSPELTSMLELVEKTQGARVQAIDLPLGRMTVEVNGDPEPLAAEFAKILWERRWGTSSTQSSVPSDDLREALTAEEEVQWRKRLTPAEEKQLRVAQDGGYVVLAPSFGRGSQCQWNRLFQLYSDEMFRRRQPSIVVGPQWNRNRGLMVITRDLGEFLCLRKVAEDHVTIGIEAPNVGFFCAVVGAPDRAEPLAEAMVEAWKARERSIADKAVSVNPADFIEPADIERERLLQRWLSERSLMITAHFSEWLAASTIEDPNAQVIPTELYDAYNLARVKDGRMQQRHAVLAHVFRHLRPHICFVERFVEPGASHTTTAYLGIRLRTAEELALARGEGV